MTHGRKHFAVFGFDNTHDALRAEVVLLAAEVDVVLIPTPRALGSLCGFAVRIPLGEREAAAGALAGAGIDPNGEIETEGRAAR